MNHRDTMNYIDHITVNNSGIMQVVNSNSQKNYLHCPENAAYSFNDRYFIITFTLNVESVTEISGMTLKELLSTYTNLLTYDIMSNLGSTITFNKTSGQFKDLVYHPFYVVSINVTNYFNPGTSSIVKPIGISACKYNDVDQCSNILDTSIVKYSNYRYPMYFKRVLPLDKINELKYWFYLSPSNTQIITIVIQSEINS